MMSSAVITKTYQEPAVDRQEILRYAFCPKASPEVLELLESCLQEALPVLSYRLAYRSFKIDEVRGDEECLDLGFTTTASASLIRHLRGCNEIILFAATAGLPMDRLIRKYSSVRPARSNMLSAIGSERVEALCDTFNDEIDALMLSQGRFTVSRFSPGYGDLPLSMQTDIDTALSHFKGTGISLNTSLLMTPSKSVTAILGIGDPQ